MHRPAKPARLRASVEGSGTGSDSGALGIIGKGEKHRDTQSVGCKDRANAAGGVFAYRWRP